jgi:hypothetical protein
LRAHEILSFLLSVCVKLRGATFSNTILGGELLSNNCPEGQILLHALRIRVSFWAHFRLHWRRRREELAATITKTLAE